MKKDLLIKKTSDDIRKKLKGNLIALYLVGSATSDKKFNDLDFFAVVKKPLDEKEEYRFIDTLTKKHKFRTALRTISYKNLMGKGKKETFVFKINLFTPQMLLKILKRGKLVYGNLDLDKIKLKPFLAKQELRFEIKKLERYIKKYGFYSQYFLKNISMLTRAELQMMKKPFTTSYEEMGKLLKNNKKHIIHDILAIRHGKREIDEKFLKKADAYVKEMKKKAK